MKKIVLTLAIVVGAVFGVSADSKLGIGLDYALYSDTDLTPAQFANIVKNGEGLFAGIFVDFRSDLFAVGGAYNFSVYDEDFSFFGNNAFVIKMVDTDLNLFFQVHPLEMDSVLDLFAELGLGYISKDYLIKPDGMNKDPILASYYFDLGLGVGLNIGPFGLFLKSAYLFNYKSVEGSFKNTVSGATETYEITKYPLKNLKVMFGAKLMF